MPPKAKAVQKARETRASTPAPPSQPPRTVNEQTRERYYLGRPYAWTIETAGISGLSPAERTAWAAAQHLGASASALSRRPALSNKAQKELWRLANEASLPLRALKSAPSLPSGQSGPSGPSSKPCTWGRDRSGRDIGTYDLDDFRARTAKRVRLTVLEVAHAAFLAKRDAAAGAVTDEDKQEERERRSSMAALRMELYGQHAGGPYAQDPDWDDVVPVPIEEPEGALAAIAYPAEYGEAISYLRAVMAISEYSPRCLRLTEHVISLNPAHYTVWLYRFSIVNALQLPVADEIAWLNEVALENLKNYQIWHHRYLLAEHYYPQLAGAEDAPAALAAFARSEMAFLATILAEDTKNYHVWSYRQYLVSKLSYWTDDELAATDAFIRQDVRNNSAWSHRFFLVFSNPAYANSTEEAEETPSIEASMGRLNVDGDPGVPAAVIERETAYAQGRILEAPQNESPWNYLKGVLAKGGRPLASAEAFASQFVTDVGGDAEDVRSTHALDVLAVIYGEQGDVARADLYLARLAEKWDPVRAGYWEYQRQALKQDAAL